MDRVPAAPPPPGVTPNFVNPPSDKAAVYSVSIGLCSAATLVLLLRLYTRGIVLRSIGLDDHFCIIGQLCAWIFCILSILNTRNGYGVHIWNLYVPDVIAFKKYDLAEEDVYCVGMFFVKCSILVFYFRLNPNRRFRQLARAIIAFVFAYSLVSILVFTFMCRPVAAQWDITMKGKCINQLSFIYANAAFNIFSDFATLILPIRLFWSLQTSLKQKLLLMVVFIAGSFACIVAILRIVTMMPYTHSNDATWFKRIIANWCMVEINVAVICACLPTIRPLLVQILPRIFQSSHGDSKMAGSYALQDVESQSRSKSTFRRTFKGRTTISSVDNNNNDSVFRGWNITNKAKTTVGKDSGRDSDSDSESAQGIVKRGQLEDGVIAKSTEYTVSYESSGEREREQQHEQQHVGAHVV